MNCIELINHYKIFDDLFMPGVYFNNTQNVKIQFDRDSSSVYFGNLINAKAAHNAPNIELGKIGSSSNGFNSILMVNIDGYGFTSEEDLLTQNDDNKTNGIFFLILIFDYFFVLI